MRQLFFLSVLLALLLCSTLWQATEAQDDASRRRELLEKAKNWTRQTISSLPAGFGRVVTIAHPPQFYMIDEKSEMMPIVIYSSLKGSSNTTNATQQSATTATTVPIAVYLSLARHLDQALRRLTAIAEKTYAVSSDNVVATIKNYTVHLLFDSTNFNNSVNILINKAIANCNKNKIEFSNCTIEPFKMQDFPLAVVVVFMQANRIGRSNITFMFRADPKDVTMRSAVSDVSNVVTTNSSLTTTSKSSGNDTYVAEVVIIVVRPERTLDIIFRFIMTVFLIIITFGMGCELDLKVILRILKRPFAPIIGFCSQFVMMPLLSFGIGQIFLNTPDTKLFGFGLLVVGCSPGGGSSNMWALMLGGHLDLSMTMTFFSSTFALGMMPLWLYILGPFYVDPSQVQIPFVDIVKNLLLFTVPAAFGIGLRSLKPHVADKVQKPVKWAVLLYLIFMVTFGNWVNFYMYRIISYFPYLIPIGMILPWSGMLFGYLLAFLLRQGHRNALTIGIETGIQNAGIAMIILRFAFPPPDGQLAAVVVMIIILFTPIPLYLSLIGRGIYFYVKKRKGADGEIDSDSQSSLEHGVKLKAMDDYEVNAPNNRSSDMQPLRTSESNDH